MARGPSARELRWIREKYARMPDDELLLVNKEKIIPEAREILASEFLSRGWDQQKIDSRRSELEKQKQQQRPAAGSHSLIESPPLGNPTIWGILVVLIVIVATDVDSWAVKLICALFGSMCIVQGKRCRDWKQKVMQVERDKAARDILDKLGANKSGEHKDVR